jgi:ribonuclease BN (tRNA processing enzyme)
MGNNDPRRFAGRRRLLAGLGALASNAVLPAFASQPNADAPLSAVLLGTQGGPNFNLVRGESASVVRVDGRLYLVDCGYGALAALVRAGLNYRDVGRVFLTHLHDDHVADVVSLLGHQWTGGRIEPTVVHGPTGTARLVDAAIRYNQVNEEIRLVDEARSARVADLHRAQEIAASAEPVVVLREGGLTVRAVENTHYPPASKQHTTQRSIALRFDAGGRSIVFSGDTAYSTALVALARGADVLVCEAMHVVATRRNFDERVKAGAYADNPEGIWTHIVETHTPLDVAGRMAREAGVRTLVLNHIIPGGWEPGLDDEFYRREAAREFRGEIIVGRDGLTI